MNIIEITQAIVLVDSIEGATYSEREDAFKALGYVGLCGHGNPLGYGERCSGCRELAPQYARRNRSRDMTNACYL
jgi:hypothetical protein